MGQSQSADGANRPQEDEEEKKTDYYELLGVDHEATDDEWVANRCKGRRANGIIN
jgi:hypothetical protein